MRRNLRWLLPLLFVCSAVWAQAQSTSFARRAVEMAPTHATENTNRLAAPSAERIAVPMHDITGMQVCDAQVRLGTATAGNHPAALTSALCGPDTVQYPLGKATGLNILNYSDSVAFGQYYDAPQPITVSGMTFYSWVDSATNQQVTLTCRLFNAGLDSLPTGAPLATATITIDSNFFGGSLAALEKSVSWTPVTVNAPYVITVENLSSINCGMVTNDYTATPRDGLQEWLGMVYLGAVSGWLHGYELNVGPNPFDADVLLFPHATYDVTANFLPNPATACPNIPAAFLDQSSPILQNRMYNQAAFQGVPEASYDWDYGDGSPVANVINATHTYTMMGSYTVTLVDSMFGWRVQCASTATGSMIVAPGSAITANYTYTNAGLTATFTDASTPAAVGWLWDFGDGNTSTLQNPTHTYAAGGVYTVCLIAANQCGADTTCQSVLVGNLPAANCDTFTNISGNAALFTSPNGGFVAGHNGFLDSAKAERFNLPGPFAFNEALYFFGSKESPTPNTSRIIATVWDATGTGGTPGAVLATQDVFFSQIDTSGALTSVTFPNTISTNGNFYVGFQLIYQPGDTVGLVTNSQGQTVPATAWELFSGGTTWVPFDDTLSWGLQVSLGIFVVQAVEADFNQSASGLTANFTDQSLGANGWAWDFGDGNTSTQQSPTHTYAASGTYTVCLVAFNGTCSDTTCQTVTVSGGCPPPSAAFTSSVSNLTATFTDQSTGTTPINTWFWDFGDGSTSTTQNPIHTYGQQGTYTVCLTVTDSCGTDSTCNSVTIACPPLVAAFQDTVIGLQIGVLDQSTGTPTNWIYDWGDGSPPTVGQPNTFHTYAQAGVYTVCLTVTDSCSSDSTCATVIIGCPIPIAGFTFSTTGQVVTFTDQSSNLPTSWAWDFGDGNTSTLQNPTHTYATADTFIVCLIASSTCGADTICDTVVSGCNSPIAAYNVLSQTNLTVTFVDQSTNAPTNWLWDFGDGNTSTAQNPSHVYAQAGSYTVCLTVSSICGTDSTCQTVLVNCPLPATSFNNTTSGLTTSFVDQSTNSPTSWLWDFGDGNTSTQQSPTHTYTQGGTYQVCLTATNACGSAQTCTVININCPVPNGNFSFTSVNLAFNFQDGTTGSPTAWFWDFGDGNTSTQQNPAHTYANTGTYLVCLTTLNSCGADTICQTVNANCPVPTSLYSFSANNLTVNFTDLSTNNPTGWQWDFGDGSGTSIQNNPSYTYPAPGTYQVCLSAVNACGANLFCDSVTVGCPAPSAAFNFLTTGPIVNFTDLSTAGATAWMWDFGDGNTSMMQNPTYTYQTTDTFTVCLISSSICGSDTICQPVIITCVPPEANYSFNVSSDSIVNFTNQASTNSTAFSWDFGDGNTSTAANPQHIYAGPGSYTACLIVTNSCGTDTFCDVVEITCVNPSAGYTVQVTNSVAAFNDVSILAQSYAWDFGDGNTSTMASPTHTYTSTGIYTVCLTVTNFCGSNTTCQNVVITCNTPTPSFSFSNGTGVVNFTDNSLDNPTTWFWDFGDGGTDTVQNPTHAYIFAGQFYVCLTVTNSCGTADTCEFITVTSVATDEEDLIRGSLQVYPNPGSGLFSIEAELPKAMDLAFKVTNTLGQEVAFVDAGRKMGVYRGEIDLRQFANGTYILEITAGEHKLYRNLVKQ
ncbi:MAG: PKD domain-containing protein [Bacteroidota bacterium]